MKDKTTQIDIQLNQTLTSLTPSIIRAFTVEAQNIDQCISLALGEPCEETPLPIRNALKQALDEGYTHYAPMMGDLKLREKIRQFEYEQNHLHYSLDEILISHGASEAMAVILAGILNPDDEVLVPIPCYPQYETLIRLSQAKFIPLKLNDHDQIDEQTLRTQLHPKTKAIILTSPNNPTGSIYTKKTIEMLHQVLKETKVLIICDDVYEALVYDGKPQSLAHYADLKERILRVKSFSKPYAMTGWRLGYLLAPAPILSKLAKLHQARSSCVNTFVQKAAITALDQDCSPMVESLRQRRDYLCDRLNQMGLPIEPPAGAFYVFVDISKTGLDDFTFCKRLLHEAKLACVPGSAFYGEGFIRISYCVEMEILKVGMDRLEQFLRDQRSI